MVPSNKGLLFIFLLILFASESQGQSFQFSFHRLSPLEGLSQGTNQYVYRDSRGFVWLSSIDGLNRFDGTKVKVYKADPATGLLGNIITSNFYEDDDNNLWFTSYEAIHCYVRKQDRFLHFQLQNENQDTIQQDYFAFHLDKKQTLWLQTGFGETGRLHHFHLPSLKDRIIGPLDGRWHELLFDSGGQAHSIVSGNFYSKTGIDIRSISVLEQPVPFFSKKDKLPDLTVYDLVVEQDSLFWMASENGLAEFNPITGKVIFHDRYNGQFIGNAWAIGSLNAQYLIVSTEQASMLIFDKKNRTFVQQIPFDPNDQFGLQLEGVNAFYLDEQKNLWLSTSRGGLLYGNLLKRKFQMIEPLRNTAIISLYESSDGRIWCNGKSGKVFGLTKNGDNYQEFKLHSSNPNIPIQKAGFFFEDQQQNLWVGFSRYLFKWNQGNNRFEYTQELPNSIIDVYSSKSEGLILATYSGIYKLQLEDQKFRITKFNELKSYQPQLATAVYEDKSGRIYLALDAKRLVIFKKNEQHYENIKTVNQIGYAKSFYETEDMLWVATTNGLLSIQLKNLEHQMYNKTEHGIPKEHFYSILPDNTGGFWLSCNRGIIFYDPSKKTHRRYTLADGIQDIEYNTNAYLKSKDGTIWMGGNKGLNAFFPSEVKEVPYAPQIQFAELLINDEPYPTDVQIGELESLTLPFQKNTISITSRALEYSDPKNNRFQYRLKNYDDDWVNVGTSGFARYPNLPAGQYVFQVKAANSDGVWNHEQRELNIEILTPWWQTWTFYLSCLLLLSVILYALFTYRLQQALKIERMRVKISSDLHDDVGSILTGLAMQAEVVGLSAKEENKPKLNRISELSRNALSRMRDTVWAIDARKDKLENLLFRMQEHAEETLTPIGIRFGIQSDPSLDLTRKLPTNIRQSFYLIYKEAVTNIAKHSNGKHVSVQLKEFKQGLSMLIHDDGKVKQKAYKTSGLGLSNMEMRAKQIGATFQIDTSAGYLIKIDLHRI